MACCKKTVFYAAVCIILIGGQFVVTGNLATGTPPHIAATTLDGETTSSKIGTGPALIYFWADWCRICKAMQPQVNAVLQDYPGVTIALQSGDSGKVRAYLHQQGLNWPTVVDADGRIAADYGVKGVPAAFIVDNSGKIRFAATGFSSETGLRFRLWLAGVLFKKRSAGQDTPAG